MNLSQIAIPPNFNEIGDNAFNECSSLVRVSMPSSIKTIGNYAFAKCSSLKSISIPSSVTKINSYAFSECSSLTKVTIPFFVKSIEPHAFDSCNLLEFVNIPPSVTKIENYAFNMCSHLMYINISPSVKTIGINSFKGCVFLDHLCPDFNDNKRSGPFANDPIGFALFGLFLVIPTFCCLVATFISTIVWWSRIHPWFSHGYKSGKIVYISLMLCWISSLILFILSVTCFLALYFVDRCKIYRLKEIINITAITIFVIFALISLISGIVASCYALKNDKINGESIKCLKYIIDGYQGASDWVANQSTKKQNDLNDWYSNMLKKAYQKNGKVSNYYCIGVGVPTVIFSIIPLLILFYILGIILIDFIRNF